MKPRSLHVPVAIPAFLCLLLCPSHGRAAVRFVGLGDLPGGDVASSALSVSANGSIVFGASASAATPYEAFRWTAATGMRSLPNVPAGTIVRAISFNNGLRASTDGTRVAATVFDGVPRQGVRWTAGDGIVGVNVLSGGGTETYAQGMSPDGRIVVGQGDRPVGKTEAFRWTSEEGIKGLGFLNDAQPFSAAWDTSADGSVIVGFSLSTAAGFEAFRWTESGGMKALGDLDGGEVSSSAQAISDNGAVIVGSGTSAVGREACRWTSGLGLQGLGDLPGGVQKSDAWGVSADGSVIVGMGTAAAGEQAVYWLSDLQPRILQDRIANEGLQLPGWRLTSANDISPNGLNIVGTAINPTGSTEAFLVRFLYAPPTIALTGKPKVRAKKNGKFKVQGTAADDAVVVRVEYQLGGKGAWIAASGTGGWLVAAKLKKSAKKPTVLVRSVDEDGQLSPTVFATITR